MNQSQLMLKVLLLALLWGPSFLFIKISIQEISPISLVTLRIALSAIIMLILLKIKKIPLPSDLKTWKDCFIMGIFASSIPFILFGYSLTHIDSSLSALINGTTPVMTVLLANIYLKDEPFTFNRFLGTALSLSGFLVLFLPSIFDKDFDSDSLGMLLSFIAACCYAIGMVYARKNIKPPKEWLILPTLQLCTSLIYLIPLSYCMDSSIAKLSLSFKTLSAIAGLAFFGTVLAFRVYYNIVMIYGATALSTVTYILPIFSTLFGIFFLDETISYHFCIAAGLILLGTMAVNGLITFPLPRKHNVSTMNE